MPLLGIVYGLSFRDALNLPAWQFDIYVKFAHQHQARSMLDLYQAFSIGNWGDKEGRRDYVENLNRSAYPSSSSASSNGKKELVLPTQEELRERMKVLDRVSSIPTIGKQILSAPPAPKGHSNDDNHDET